MEKQKKQFLGMLLVLAVLAAAYGGIHVYNQKQEEKEASEEEAEKLTVVDFKTDDVTAFSYVLGGQVYAYTKTDGEWTWDGDISLTLDTSQIDAMLDAVTGLTAESEITDGEDLAQEAFVTCAQSIKSLRDGSKFRPWLLRTLSRAAWKYCRKAKRETPVSEFFDAGESESALSAVLRTDEQRRLYAALDTLDEKRRVTVVLYYFDDRSVREIAQATGVTEGTVKSRLFSARRHLRQALTEERKPKEAANHG